MPIQASKGKASSTTKAPRVKTRRASAYHHGDLPQALKRATLEVLSGPDAHLLSFRDLARRLGVTTGAPYHHFKDRTGLLVSLAVDGYGHLHDEFVRASQQSSEYSLQIEALTLAYLGFARREKGYYTAMFLPEVSAALTPELRAAANRSFDLICTLISQHNAQLTQEQVSERTVTIWSFLHGMITLSAAGPLSRRLPYGKQDHFAISSVKRCLGISAT
ncbi:TetR/AcrR family transcriptional regulator [Terriglobus tenax]|uniref:TetR/AcrR family transcriptional regulator n=1 Tax=Terriglobus tenax TaxID=1111115 RepID=UPI0021DFAC43|nr:TetR/AcrR family transcriptional regulator [Terriglobus tenax]